MAGTITKGYEFGATELVTHTKLHTMVDGATITGIVSSEIADGTIVDGDIAASTITDSKLADRKQYTVALLSATTVPLNADGDTNLYTVPTGKRCILSHAVLVAGADAGTSDISIGADTAETNFVGVTNLDNLDAQYDAMLLAPVPSATPTTLKSYAATTVIQAKVANQAGGATNTLYLFGTLY